MQAVKVVIRAVMMMHLLGGGGVRVAITYTHT